MDSPVVPTGLFPGDRLECESHIPLRPLASLSSVTMAGTDPHLTLSPSRRRSQAESSTRGGGGGQDKVQERPSGWYPGLPQPLPTFPRPWALSVTISLTEGSIRKEGAALRLCWGNPCISTATGTAPPGSLRSYAALGGGGVERRCGGGYQNPHLYSVGIHQCSPCPSVLQPARPPTPP